MGGGSVCVFLCHMSGQGVGRGGRGHLTWCKCVNRAMTDYCTRTTTIYMKLWPVKYVVYMLCEIKGRKA